MLLDSNIVIYAAEPENANLLHFLERENKAVSSVSQVEVLGFHRLEEYKKSFFEAFLQAVDILPLTEEIVSIAIELRQQRRMGLGDAIIAATAIAHNHTLLTHNTRDFQWIEGLVVQDPMPEQSDD